ncbi:vomeronasal type-2 receptor 26-like [Leptodactylus fuscus]|uniref:vomeronasal type-2 receptor 26-like n=1 Tax=Leptodactylus fuscus TaxID=238119 RepID=UPI003F4ECDFA
MTSGRDLDTDTKGASPETVVPLPSFYRHILAFIFAIDEINRNPNILPNVTLGYHVTDSCNSINLAIENVLQILSGPQDIVPNYSCLNKDKLVGVIGDQSSKTSLHIIEMLNVYGYSQISYGATDSILTNKNKYPSFFQTLPSDHTQSLAIVKLLRYFGWTWIGVVASDDDGGHAQSEELKKQTKVHDICIEFILKVAADDAEHEDITLYKSREIFNKATSKIIVLCGTISLMTIKSIERVCTGGLEKLFIVSAGSVGQLLSLIKYITSFQGSLLFSLPTKKIPYLKKFLDEIGLVNRPSDTLLQHILAIYLKCLTSDIILNILVKESYGINLYNCSKNVKISDIGSKRYYTNEFGTTYHVYKAVYAMAHALHDATILRPGHLKGNQKQRMKYFLRRLHFQDPTGEDVHFNEKGEMTTYYHINNFIITNNTNNRFKEVGRFNKSLPEQYQLLIDTSKMFWKHGEIPLSKCSADCRAGHQRILAKGLHKCCFECIPCSNGEISNESDQGSCFRCPEDQWPNGINQCVPKTMEYLSYIDDPITLTISVFTLFLFLKTSIILGIFILFRDTPVVKASNENLSFILLASIILSFICVLLFLGRPIRVTCMLRQTSLGIIFSVAISTVLAKTIIVYMAFKATKPGSSWKKFLGVKITNCLVFVGSFIQVVISIVWLSIAPPFPENNSNLYADKIILQCNEGSMLAFSILLGYMGLLAAVSFIVAFLARNLPDSFNEAKNITFSMLVVCSVWVAFIPAYMSVTGKNTVLVEIFAIISSSVGILACIFYPKCYIIIMRPNLNSKCNLLKRI